MGKVKKIRQKYHLTLKKSKSLDNLTESETKTEPVPPEENLFKSSENIFAGINISFDELVKKLPDDLDVKSILSTKSRQELKEEESHLTKKEKLKLRHERFMKKLEAAEQMMDNSKKKMMKQKKKKKTVVGDMSSLLEALPTLPSPTADSSEKKVEKPKTKVKGILKAKQRLKQQSRDVKFFKKILEDKTFQANPIEAISQYLKQRAVTET